MPIPTPYPGVYVQEVPSGVRTIVGVSTSTALFVGRSAEGPLSLPVPCLNLSDFTTAFGDDATGTELPLQVRQFFTNGGSTAYVMRIANGAKAAAVTLGREDKNPALILTAASPGTAGDRIRAEVRYDADRPEATFTLEVFRWAVDASGAQVKTLGETWRNLSMDPSAAAYAPDFLTRSSRLVRASVPATPTAAAGFSQAGRPIDMAQAAFAAAWGAVVTATSNQFALSIGSAPFVTVTVPLTGITDEASMTAALTTAVRTALATVPGNPGAAVAVTTVNAPPAVIGTPDTSKWIRITHPALDVTVRPSLSNDLAVPLMLGSAQGGWERGAYAAARPAPTGLSVAPDALFGTAAAFLASQDPANVTGITLPAASPVPFGAGTLQTGGATAAMYKDAYLTSPNGHSDGLREKLALIAQYVNDAATDPAFPWTARVWGYRLNFVRRTGTDNDAGGAPTFTGWSPSPALVDVNVRYYSLGTSGTGDYQTAGAAGDDGTAPKASDYAAAYPIADREIDVFNLLLLPDADGVDRTPLWGPASVFCQQRRAFLVMDAPLWTTAAEGASGVDALRIGLVKDHAAIYYPRVSVDQDGRTLQIGASGSIAGLMARIDSTRGVWKAPAGTEADVRGITRLERRLSDAEHGLLNPKAVDVLRVFPTGVVCWGARTMDGDDASPADYKYVPVRRLALYLEGSLYRGLQWTVFEPNDEPLWAQIRLNVGAFLHGLFVQGAFQGQKSSDAYFVRCDSETTTQDDRNKGIVNVWVGFAPLKPAEFVVLYLQQMAGQIAV